MFVYLFVGRRSVCLLVCFFVMFVRRFAHLCACLLVCLPVCVYLFGCQAVYVCVVLSVFAFVQFVCLFVGLFA